MNKYILAFVFLLTSYSLSAQIDETRITAITRDGKMVILNSDGTWHYNEESIGSTLKFRGMPWGSTKEFVLNNESNQPVSVKDTYLLYEGSISNFSCSIFYVFVNDLFVRGRYYFTHDHTNNNDYIDDFKFLSGLLYEKYGEPTYDEIIWKSDLYKQMPSIWGTAVSTGMLEYYKYWILDDTIIHIQLFGDNFKVRLVIDYKSVVLEHLEKEEKAKTAKDQL